MARKDLHDKPFDEGTIAKLEIFEDYTQAWIPTFIMQNYSEICIVDFFAGTGYDINGVPGSPIRILNSINDFAEVIAHKGIKINLYLNEYMKKKFELLNYACVDFISKNPRFNELININYFNNDFEELFPFILKIIKRMPSLIFLDQNGMKFLSDKYFLEFASIKQADFLYFLSSSYIWRFGTTEEFRMNLDIDMDKAKKNPYKYVHRSILAQLKTRIPKESKLQLYPFSIKKGSNIHGIIFGASHIRAVDKFLSIAWKRNETNGEANFDIDDDLAKEQLDLFEERKFKKIESFQQRLREKILCCDITDNFGAYNFALQEGHIPNHAAQEIKKMKDEKLISYDARTPLVTYENVYKNDKRINYKVLR